MNEQAFLADVLAHPGDEALRLIFADWLDEHGQPDRAEFIRVECRRETVPDFYPEWDALDRRSRELLDANEERWVGPLAALVEEFSTRRGFVDSITLKASRFLENASAIVELAPVRELFLLQASARARALAGCPHLARIERLSFDICESATLGPAGGRAIAASPHLTNLLELDLTGCEVGVSGFKALMCSKSFPRLESLELANNSVGNGVYAYLRRARFPALKDLNLGANNVNDACLAGLAWANSLEGLEELHLYHNHLTVAGIHELLRWSHLPRLQWLNLHSNPLGDDGVQVLAGAPLDSLRKLHLGSVGLSVAGLKSLAAAPLPNLRNLTLRDNPLRSAGRSLAKATWLPGLTSLNLDGCHIGRSGLLSLLEADRQPRLQSLWLAGNKLDDKAVVELARSPILEDTTFLSLENNPLGPRSGEALLGSPYLQQVRYLSLPKAVADARRQEALRERFSQAKVYFA